MARKIAKTIFILYALLAVFCLCAGAAVLFAPAGMKPDLEAAAPILLVGFPWSFGGIALLTGKEPSPVIFTLLGLVPLGLNTFLLWLLQRWIGRKSAS